MDIVSELVYEITHFNFMIWLLSILTVVLCGIPLLLVIRGIFKSFVAARADGPMISSTYQNPKPKKKVVFGMVLVFPILLMMFFWVLFGYIFAFSMKDSREYECAVGYALKDPAVTDALGKDVTAGNFAWISSFESGGGFRTAYFRVLLKGSKGVGNLYISSYVAPAISTMQLEFESPDDYQRIYTGTFPCN